ncbi:hypothetical protein F7725_027361 [Dissostichus mawsoni]|uniref:Uncharacterized protein n=1 Tax=Dissostichus mawsoni TaxID=36200 RepID=A0A7J5XD76_DISMA|nr:hypothetical protein F7725_027361 [Dissostichus mawsoni]
MLQGFFRYRVFSLRVFQRVSEDLLGAGGGDVQKSPGGVRVQLLLVPTQSPHGPPPPASLGVSDHHHQLSLEGDDQHRTLVHHLPHGQLQ